MTYSLFSASLEGSIELGFRRPTAPGRPISPGPGPTPGRRPTTGTPSTAPTDDFSANTGTTGSIAPGGLVSGVINAPADSDWFAITLQAGRSYTINLRGVSLSDPILAVRDSQGSFLVENDDTIPDTNLNSRLQFSPKSSGTYFLDVRGFGNLTGSYQLQVEDTSQATPSPGAGFQIDIDYSGDPRYLPIFQAAAARWQQVITADLPDVNGIDDLLITVNVGDIDGSGGTLGFAGPDSFRSAALGGLPLTGSTTLDSADLASLEVLGILDDTVLHEFGHILGIGTIWDRKGLRSGSDYTGVNARREYQSLGGQNSFVPLETNGGPGTALGHWSEDVFDNELMTGFINRQANPLSKLTIGSLQDLGYSVNYNVADSYALPSAVRSSSAPVSVPGTNDMLLNSLQGCYCATCAGFSIPGSDLAQFANEVAGSTVKSTDAFSDQQSLSNGGQSTVFTTKGVVLVLPSYLTNQELVETGIPRDSSTVEPTYGFFDNNPLSIV